MTGSGRNWPLANVRTGSRRPQGVLDCPNHTNSEGSSTCRVKRPGCRRSNNSLASWPGSSFEIAMITRFGCDKTRSPLNLGCQPTLKQPASNRRATPKQPWGNPRATCTQPLSNGQEINKRLTRELQEPYKRSTRDFNKYLKSILRNPSLNPALSLG